MAIEKTQKKAWNAPTVYAVLSVTRTAGNVGMITPPERIETVGTYHSTGSFSTDLTRAYRQS